MERKKVAKLAGFTGALCATAALAGFTVSSTGAYFSDSQSGSVGATSGHLKLNSAQERNLAFKDLTPGSNETKSFDYSVDTTVPAVDVWLVFDKNSAAYQNFTGGKQSPLAADGGQGRFMYFSVKANSHVGGATPGFSSGNLSFADGSNTPNTGPATAGECHVDADGTGGSDTVAQSSSDFPPKCGVPSAIKLVSNVPNGDYGNIAVTLGLNGPLTKGQYADKLPGGVPFKIVATQQGVAPGA